MLRVKSSVNSSLKTNAGDPPPNNMSNVLLLAIYPFQLLLVMSLLGCQQLPLGFCPSYSGPGFKPGISWYELQIQLSKANMSAPSNGLKGFNRDLNRLGYNYKARNRYGQNAILGIMCRGTVFSHASLADMVKFEKHTKSMKHFLLNIFCYWC